MGKKFIIYGLIGWCLEIIWTGLGSLMKGDVTLSSFTSIWMFFIYGLAVFLENIHNKIRNNNVFIRGIIYTLIIFAIEYTTGFILKIILGSSPWDYGNNYFSVNGLIRLDYTLVWFFTGLLFERIHDKLDEFFVRAKI